MRAGFAETDITPPVGTLKIGWKKIIVSEDVLDPIFARAAVFENGPARVGFIQLDTLSVRWTQASQIRAEIERRFGFPGSNVMVSATHNHAGPAVANAGDVPRDERYVKLLVERSVQAFGDALGRMTEAQVGFGSCFEFRVSHNRRVVMRDGTVRTHGTFSDPMALYIEGPIDPEVCVLAARDLEGELLGAMVNFACHPTHHGPDSFISAGFPGVLAREMKDAGCPVTLYLNGSSGNLHTSDPSRGGQDLGMEEAGRILASDAKMVIDSLMFEDDLPLRSVSKTIHLPFRRITRRELEGRVRGAQRFIDNSIYEREMPRLLERIRRMGRQPRCGRTVTLAACTRSSVWPDCFRFYLPARRMWSPASFSFGSRLGSPVRTLPLRRPTRQRWRLPILLMPRWPRSVSKSPQRSQLPTAC